MVDTIRERGSLDIGSAGRLSTGDVKYVVYSRSAEQLLNGYPDWWTGNVIDAPYDGVLAFDGRSKVYDGNPIPLLARGTLAALDQGYIKNVDTDWRGTFEDFAIYGYDGTSYFGRDPATEAFVLNGNAGTTNGSGDVTTAWTRHYRTLYPPKNARFMVPHIQINSTANNKGHYFDAFMVEVPTLGTTTPGTYVEPRSIYARVLPTRLNHSTNPSFLVSTANVAATGATLTRDTTDSYRGDGCLKVAVSGSGGISVRQSTTVEVDYGENLTVSLRAKNGALSGTYRPMVIFLDQSGDEVSRVLGDAIHDKTNGWEVRSVVTNVPFGAYQAQVQHAYSTASNAADVFYIDAVLIEKTDQVKPFFDGTFDSREYLWETGGTPGLCRSYFYEDRTKRHYIIKRVLGENLPLGTQIAAIDYANGFKFGTPYGFGPYGSEPYGG